MVIINIVDMPNSTVIVAHFILTPNIIKDGEERDRVLRDAASKYACAVKENGDNDTDLLNDWALALGIAGLHAEAVPVPPSSSSPVQTDMFKMLFFK